MPASIYDFTKGVDFVALAPAAAGDHNNLVDLAVPYATDKGIVVRTTDTALDTPDVPDAVTTTKWRNYLWVRALDASATVTTPYIYMWDNNVAVDATYQQWVRVTADETSTLALIAALDVRVTANEAGIANALAVANAANAAASNAGSNAAEALSTANAANANSATALSTANTALQNANTAQVTADQANLTANSALTIVNNLTTQVNATGSLVQTVKATDNTFQAILAANAIPVDDTIPVITEGTAIMTATITPKSATNKLTIRAIVNIGGTAAAGSGVIAIFLQGSTNAIATAAIPATLAYVSVCVVEATITAGMTGAMTFQANAGPSPGNDIYINGTLGARLFGGVMLSSLSVTEVVAA